MQKAGIILHIESAVKESIFMNPIHDSFEIYKKTFFESNK